MECRYAWAGQKFDKRKQKRAILSPCCAAQETVSNDLAAFERNASGEWEGVSATFSAKGEPQELPPNYVPDAFREWEIKLYDWQTQSSTLAHGKKLRRQLKRLMPTVGCEADSVAFTEEDQTTDVSHDDKCGNFLEDGSYSLPAVFDGQKSAQAEHCFSTGHEQRLRIIQNISNLSDGMTVKSIEVHRERREGDYNGGKVLAGCGGGMPTFAEKQRLDDTALEGNWQPNAAASIPNVESSNVVKLPLQTWSEVSMDGRMTVLSAGCMISESERYVVHQTYEDAKIQNVEMIKQHRD